MTSRFYQETPCPHGMDTTHFVLHGEIVDRADDPATDICADWKRVELFPDTVTATKATTWTPGDPADGHEIYTARFVEPGEYLVVPLSRLEESE